MTYIEAINVFKKVVACDGIGLSECACLCENCENNYTGEEVNEAMEAIIEDSERRVSEACKEVRKRHGCYNCTNRCDDEEWK